MRKTTRKTNWKTHQKGAACGVEWGGGARGVWRGQTLSKLEPLKSQTFRANKTKLVNYTEKNKYMYAPEMVLIKP